MSLLLLLLLLLYIFTAFTAIMMFTNLRRNSTDPTRCETNPELVLGVAVCIEHPVEREPPRVRVQGEQGLALEGVAVLLQQVAYLSVTAAVAVAGVNCSDGRNVLLTRSGVQ